MFEEGCTGCDLASRRLALWVGRWAGGAASGDSGAGLTLAEDRGGSAVMPCPAALDRASSGVLQSV